MTASATTEQRFGPPGAGSREIDGTHHPRPAPRFYTDIQPEALAAGFRESTRRHGLLLDHLEFQWVNGFAYVAARYVPPAEVRARSQTAERAFRDRLWREDLRRSDEQVKLASIEAHLALQAVDPARLLTDRLLAYLDRCREHLTRMIFQHHRLNAPAMRPVGDYLVHATEWTALPRVELLDLPLDGVEMATHARSRCPRGSSPRSAPQSTPITGADGSSSKQTEPARPGSTSPPYTARISIGFLPRRAS